MKTELDSPRPRNAERTREAILDAAQALILDHGFASTTVEAVVGRAGITKGAFFHHFASKNELARALVDRYAFMDNAHLQQTLERATRLASDPLQRLLLVIALYEEEFEAMAEPFPGCLFASYVYENKLFDAGTNEVLRDSALHWRKVVWSLLDEIVRVYPPKIPVDLESLADLFYSLSEGAFIMTKMLGDKTLLQRQARHLRNYLELLFAPDASPKAPAAGA